MTEDAVRRAICSAVHIAHRIGRDDALAKTPQTASLANATAYAEALILPVVEMYAQEAIEQADAARLRACAQADLA